MAYEYGGDRALDYFPCRYGQSRLLFRGPPRNLDGAYAVVMGGTETYGKFVPDPYAALLEEKLGLPVFNFGYINAGLDVFMGDPVVIDTCRKARVTVVQLLGAPNMSNRFYTVHPRRNDRFLKASLMMRSLFREVDFTEFHFIRHMLTTLKTRARERFALVEEELKSIWVTRMQALLERIGGTTLLLLVGDHHPGSSDREVLGPDPLMVDEGMIAAVRPCASDIVRVQPSDRARAARNEGMFFAPLEEPVALELPGPQVHQEIASALLPVLRAHL